MATIECCVCLEPYDRVGQRSPKLLPCSHTICVGCLGRLVQGGHLQCPECRYNHDVPNGNVNDFQNNRYLLHVLETKRELAGVHNAATRAETQAARRLEEKEEIIRALKQERHEILEEVVSMRDVIHQRDCQDLERGEDECFFRFRLVFGECRKFNPLFFIFGWLLMFVLGLLQGIGMVIAGSVVVTFVTVVYSLYTASAAITTFSYLFCEILLGERKLSFERCKTSLNEHRDNVVNDTKGFINRCKSFIEQSYQCKGCQKILLYLHPIIFYGVLCTIFLVGTVLAVIGLSTELLILGGLFIATCTLLGILFSVGCITIVLALSVVLFFSMLKDIAYTCYYLQVCCFDHQKMFDHYKKMWKLLKIMKERFDSYLESGIDKVQNLLDISGHEKIVSCVHITILVIVVGLVGLVGTVTAISLSVTLLVIVLSVYLVVGCLMCLLFLAALCST